MKRQQPSVRSLIFAIAVAIITLTTVNGPAYAATSSATYPYNDLNTSPANQTCDPHLGGDLAWNTCAWGTLGAGWAAIKASLLEACAWRNCQATFNAYVEFDVVSGGPNIQRSSDLYVVQTLTMAYYGKLHAENGMGAVFEAIYLLSRASCLGCPYNPYGTYYYVIGQLQSGNDVTLSCLCDVTYSLFNPPSGWYYLAGGSYAFATMINPPTTGSYNSTADFYTTGNYAKVNMITLSG